MLLRSITVSGGARRAASSCSSGDGGGGGGRLWMAAPTARRRQPPVRSYSSSSSTGPASRTSGPSAAAPPEDEVLEEHKGSAVIITLNRPKSLNALNLSMVRALTPKYRAWHAHPSQNVVVVMKGAGGKAFCAGGDIRAMYDLGKAWHAVAGAGAVASSATRGSSSPSSAGDHIGAHATEFFREEYTLNHLIATLPQPHVALLNGITMGGGVGLSVHGKFRVATESTVFAMPETGIGFFCDVGGSFFLPRLAEGGLGLYLALTGNRLKGGAVQEAGIATHYVPLAQLEELQSALASAVPTPTPTSTPTNIGANLQQSSAQVKATLDRFATAPPAQDQITNLTQINHCFGAHHGTLESVMAALNADGSSWATETLKAMARASPTSLRVVFRQLQEGRQRSTLAECLKMEYRMADTFLHPDGPSRDFFEGVRATLVDKDKEYKWAPASVDKVSEADVRPFFDRTPTGGDLNLN